MIRETLRRLRREESGATLIEFALVAPVLMIIISGLFDLAYRQYVQAVLLGAVDKAARAATLANNNTSQSALDTAIVNAIRPLNSGVTASSFVFTRRNFSDFTNADKMEPSTGPGGACAAGFTYADLNNNNTYDDGAQSGQGGAQDVVLYTVLLRYSTPFPTLSLFGMPAPQAKATALLRNQPFADKSARNAGTTRNCP